MLLNFVGMAHATRESSLLSQHAFDRIERLSMDGRDAMCFQAG